MNWIAEQQQQRNRMSRDCWQLYRPHRERVTELLLGRNPPSAERLCVLGAGNCNDLDLNLLAGRFTEIRLIDLDIEALRSGLAAQGHHASERIQIIGGIDLSGITTHLRDWSADGPPGDLEFDRCLRLAGDAQPLPDSPPHDVVASVCLLSQIVESVTLALGEQHPRCLELISAVRRCHLQVMLDLLRPGGRGLLVIDFSSSATSPELETVSDDGLNALATDLIRRRNFFTGMNPFVLRKLLDEEPAFRSQIEHLQLSPPWRWHFPTRVYAVCALEFFKSRP